MLYDLFSGAGGVVLTDKDGIERNMVDDVLVYLTKFPNEDIKNT